jgi:hypothetical protein
MSARASIFLVPVVLIAAVSFTAVAEPTYRNGGRPFKRINKATAADLQRQLDEVPVVGPGSLAPAVLAAYTRRIAYEVGQSQLPVAILDASPLLEVYGEARTLPLRRGDASQMAPGSAANLDKLSRKLRIYLDQGAPLDEQGQRPDLPRLRTVLQSELRGAKPEWLSPGAIPTLLQLLTHEDKPVRMMLVELLQAIPGKVATAALARRAAFDLDPEVREAAVAALRDRPPADSRQVLVGLLNYPWAPAAEHAAEALVNLNDRGAVPDLMEALNQADPALPAPGSGGGSVVRELVRVHHLTNCILCHPPASTGRDPVLGADPVLSLPATAAGLARTVQALQGTPGSHSYGGSGPSRNTAALLRGDVTFLRQDFSVLQSMPKVLAGLRTASGPLSARTQRFDFVVRKRPVTSAVATQLRTAAAGRDDFPQHNATLFALRELTGRDAGVTYADWARQMPDADDDARAGKLCKELCQAKGDRRASLLARYRDEKGLTYTLALASAAANVEGKFQGEVRDALVERFTRMTAKTLQERLADEDAELRRAAAVACGRKGDPVVVSALIDRVDDKNQAVASAAKSSLRELTGKSFPGSPEWRSWWRDNATEGREK